MAVAGDRLCGRGQRDGLLAGQRVGHRDVEDRDGAEEDLLLAGVLAVLVALLDGDGGEDADRLLALAHAAVEIEESAEAGDVGRRDAAASGSRSRSASGFRGCTCERPLLARTLIQRCQPSVVSRARAACSMRSRSALRRASRSLVGERLAVEAAGHRRAPFGAWGPPRWRADPPPPARPPGRATIGWRVGPPAGGARATRRRRGPRRARRPCRRPPRARWPGARRAAARGPGPRPCRRRRGRA